MADEKPRIFQDGRDMAINVVLIAALMILSVAFTGMCEFNPGRPENGPVHEVDGRTFMEMEARAADFPVRFPEMPEGWTNNSARRTLIDGTPAPVAGWVTPGEGFLQVTQTGVPADEAAQADGKYREHSREETVADFPATVYTSDAKDVRDLWVVDLDDVRLLVTGAAPDAEFRELIEAFAASEPL
ncbi:DUF4245 domain-containing protein [Corynebacterium sp. CCUG 71335]|uniref:DUF4245 domain-containing protein n=1 Tax=Corynebacterium sp. CCUG 71335 TaxID=2823892 RepID=UPI00210BAB0E|nr:DUF4245 domain-containing protein [Corynebacterium sp. CCUG 71335]